MAFESECRKCTSRTRGWEEEGHFWLVRLLTREGMGGASGNVQVPATV